MRQIPVVDLDQIGIHRQGEVPIKSLQHVAEEIREAFSAIGFVYIKNHGISWRKVEEVHRVSGQFFKLPEEIKWKSKFDADKRQGYSGPDHELLNDKSRHEIRESYNVGTLDGCFPPEAPGLQPAVADLALDCRKLIMRFLKVLSIALGLEDYDYMEKRHEQLYTHNNGTTLRVLYYPPVLTNNIGDSVRCGEHSDYGTITLLFQDDVGGLEVQNVNKEWVPAPPIDETILVNVGDLLQIWSGGKFPATRHRVLVPKDEELKKKERRALTCFVHPDDHIMVSPLDGSSAYEPVNAKESLSRKFETTYQY